MCKLKESPGHFFPNTRFSSRETAFHIVINKSAEMQTPGATTDLVYPRAGPGGLYFKVASLDDAYACQSLPRTLRDQRAKCGSEKPV